MSARNKDPKPEKSSVLIVTLDMPRQQFNPAVQGIWLLEALQQFLGFPKDGAAILKIADHSTEVSIKLPKSAADSLLNAHRTGDIDLTNAVAPFRFVSVIPGDVQFLFDQLGRDRLAAGQEYVRIHAKLVKFFEWNNCPFPIDSAEITIDRVREEVLAGNYQIQPENPYGIFHRFAKFVLQECYRRKSKEPGSLEGQGHEVIVDPDEVEARRAELSLIEFRHLCLEKCKKEKLTEQEWDFLMAFYDYGQGERIDCHRALAEELGISKAALRQRVHRVKKKLEKCVLPCVRNRKVHRNVFDDSDTER